MSVDVHWSPAAGEGPAQTVRVATWNAQLSLLGTQAAIAELDCDIVALQECAESDVEQFPEARFKGPAKKGLAAVALNGWQLADAPDDPDYSNMILVQARDAAGRHVCDLAAVWVLTGTPLTYHEQFTKILEVLANRETSVPVVIAGDLNASAQGPNITGHAGNVALAKRNGLVSLYHEANAIEHGREADMTLRWIGPGREEFGYHCDFIFASIALANATESAVVGDWADWIEPGRSDHAPVIADIRY
ncbi:MAG: endonuclease/exonuclease/phosphatase family metal-dependent hydrolase [Actinomycetes bacterium]|jgi:endonuclease/exonuclease/phosphatase family metal-dependent hydrolase